MPKMEFRSNAKPSLYAYPPMLKKEKETAKEKVATAVLSVTAKAKAKEEKKKAADDMEVTESGGKSTEGEGEGVVAMDIVSPASSGEKEVATDAEKLVEQPAEQPMEQPVEKPEQVEKAEQQVEKAEQQMEKAEQPAEKEKKDPEPNFQLLVNPARVLPQQLKVLAMEDSSRYQPFKPISVGGIIMLRDTSESGEPEDLIEPLNVVVPGQEEEGEEPAPPEPFEWTDD